MKAPNITKGPWFADDNGAIWRRPPAELYENGGKVAGDYPVARSSIGSESWREDCYPHRNNAKLIAAAPMLAEALNALIQENPSVEDYLFAREVLLAAGYTEAK